MADIDFGKRVQLAGADPEAERALVGLAREVRVDTGNDSLRLHDGVKEGGYEFLNRDSSDSRYQRRSLELDGFSFGAQEKGVLVRVSPSNYKLRALRVDPANMVIVNTRGTAGDPTFSLAPTITSDHQWDGNQRFSQPISADGGVVGDVTGDLTGDVVGNLTGDVTGNLEGNAHGNATGTFTGDVNTVGHSLVLDDDQIPLAALGPDVDQQWIDRGIPYGGIIMWAGVESDIPDTWVLCNGDSGTPDLRDRFVVGAGGLKDAGDLGGSASSAVNGTMASSGAHQHQLDIAGHALSVGELPAHHHGNGICDRGGGDIFNHAHIAASPPSSWHPQTSSGSGSVEGTTTETGANATHTHTGSTSELDGAHTHDITLDSVNLLPPYYALCFIMKIV